MIEERATEVMEADRQWLRPPQAGAYQWPAWPKWLLVMGLLIGTAVYNSPLARPLAMPVRTWETAEPLTVRQRTIQCPGANWSMSTRGDGRTVYTTTCGYSPLFRARRTRQLTKPYSVM